MIDKLHDHVQEELKTNTRTDTVFIITATLLNLLSLGVNAALAAGGDTTGSTIAVLLTFLLLVIVIDAIVIIGLAEGKQTGFKLLRGLELMHTEQGAVESVSTGRTLSHRSEQTFSPRIQAPAGRGSSLRQAARESRGDQSGAWRSPCLFVDNRVSCGQWLSESKGV